MESLKALTVIQPWPDLILSGVKTVENRTWTTRHRGPILIHAGAKGNPADGRMRSAILGTAEIVDIVKLPDGANEHALPGHWHWILSNPVRFRRPVGCGGALGLWRPKTMELVLDEL